MLKSIEVQGRTEDEAIELALAQLGLSRDDVSVEILETAKTGLFGKKIPAVVKVEYESADAASESDEQNTEPVRTEGNGAAARSKTVEKKERKSASSNTYAPVTDEICNNVSDYLKGLFEHMDLDVSMNVSEKDGAVSVVLEAADPGVLIGRRGETLDALQHLAGYSINRSTDSRVRIHLDVENYRKRRSDALVDLAVRTAGKVVKYRRNMTLDPMNAYERHVIHSALQEHENISTFSIGSDANRRVVIAYGQSKNPLENADSAGYKEWH